jgi:hypothetical protein
MARAGNPRMVLISSVGTKCVALFALFERMLHGDFGDFDGRHPPFLFVLAREAVREAQKVRRRM